jgi:DNA-directed RNA polymerase specialized sigma24 family protein
MVLAAGSNKNADAARTRLCETYWYPLYAYLRHQGHSSTQSEDLTQAFFLKLLEKNYLSSATPQRGRFRSFLLTALKHFVANERDSESAQKRGGAMRFVSMTSLPPKANFRSPPQSPKPPRRFSNGIGR